MATNTGENIGKGEPPFPADVNANWYSHYGNQLQVVSQLFYYWLFTQRTPHPLRDATLAYPCFHLPFHTSKEMRATETSINRQMDDEKVVHILNRLLLSYKEKLANPQENRWNWKTSY